MGKVCSCEIKKKKLKNGIIENKQNLSKKNTNQDVPKNLEGVKNNKNITVGIGVNGKETNEKTDNDKNGENESHKQEENDNKNKDIKTEEEELPKNKLNEIKNNIDNAMKKEIEKNNYYININSFIESIYSDIKEENMENLGIISKNLEDELIIKENKKDEIKKEIEKIKQLKEKIKNNNKDKLESLNNIISQEPEEIKYSEKDINDKYEEYKKIKEELDSFDNIKAKIEVSKKIINNEKNEFIEAKKLYNKILNSLKDPKINDEFIKNSMLLIKGEDSIEGINSYEKSKEPQLLKDKWIEKCYVYDDHDLYDINYELKAVGLSKRQSFDKSSINFTKDRIIEIVEFDIDGIKSQYQLGDSILNFPIIIKGEESKKIHLKYKQSIKLTDHIKKQRKIYRNDIYGISKNLFGRYAIFHLIIKNNFEVINFDEEYFLKVKESEYKLEGIIPKEGKKTRVYLSKKEAKYSFSSKERIETKDKFIFHTTLIMDHYFEGGGNQNILNITLQTNPPDIINVNKDAKKYEIEFINIKQKFGEVEIKGELINKCSGEWKCDLAIEDIEKEIPEDYKKDKEKLKKIAQNIIKEYDETHKNNKVKITDIAKIGKWVKNNIKYDEKYEEKGKTTALQIYNTKKGICKQFTILFNGLLYSLGYKCIYVGGFAIKDNDCFDGDDAHAWSLVGVNGKWLPFDATWGIFSGKLPVSHIFESYFPKTKTLKTKDNLKELEKSKKNKIKGVFIE